MNDNFDPTISDDSGGGSRTFTPLKPGDYIMRATAFSRGTSKGGHSQLVLRLKALKGPSEGTILWYVTLSAKAEFFVKKAINATGEIAKRFTVNGRVSVGSLSSDDDMKKVFLGRVVAVSVVNRTRNGEVKDWIDTVTSLPSDKLMDFPHEDSGAYLNEAVFNTDKNSASSGSNVGGSSKDFRSGGGGNDAPVSDDDIPF